MSETDQNSQEETDEPVNIQDFFDNLDQEVYKRNPKDRLKTKILAITRLNAITKK